MSTVNTHIPSLVARRTNASHRAELAGSLRNLSTGVRVSRGADGPADLISSENLKAALAMLEAESRVIRRVDSVLTVAQSGLDETSDLLIQAKGLAIANANSGAVSQAEKAANQLQIDSILSSVDRISRTTRFNGDPLLDGTASFSVSGETLDVDGVATDQVGHVAIDGQSLALSDVGSGGALNTVDGHIDAAALVIDAAIGQVATLRGRIGAFQKSTVQSARNSIGVAIENTAGANSVVRDTDFAFETARLSRAQVLELSSLAAMDLTRGSAANVLAFIE